MHLENDLLLISLVQEHALLYNPALDGYKHPHACATAWDKIANAMHQPCIKVKGNIEVEDLRAKLMSRWKYLRMQYQKHLRNPKAFIYHSSQKYMEHLSFLKPHIDLEGNAKTKTKKSDSDLEGNAKTKKPRYRGPKLFKAACIKDGEQTEMATVYIKEERPPLNPAPENGQQVPASVQGVDASGVVDTSRIDPLQSPFGFFLSYLEAQMALVDGSHQSQLQLDLLQTVLSYQKQAPISGENVGGNSTSPSSPSSDEDPLI